MKNNNTFKEYVAPILVLVVICLVVTAALAAVYGVANPIIQENDKKTADANRTELLAEAGYLDGLDIGSMKTMSGSYFEKVMQVVQSQLAEIGITNTIEGMDGNSLVEDCITGNFTLADMGQNLSLDYDFLKTYFNEEYINGLNMARVSDSQIQELFEQGASTTDREERLAIYQEIEDLTQELCAYVPLYNLQTTTAWNKDLNYTPSVTGVLYKDCSWN